MADYDWSIYDREWYDWPPKKQGKFLIEELELHGDAVALAWFPPNSLPPKLEKYIYKGQLKLVHCQFMQRARFRGETYILQGIKNRPEPPVCDGDAYAGLSTLDDARLMMGLKQSRTSQSSGQPAKLGIFGSPAASIKSVKHHYWVIPPTMEYLAIAPLSDCPFDPDVVTIIGNPRQNTMASRALQYYTGKATTGETGPGTCSSSWVAAYMSGEARYTLGCHGVFGITGLDPSEICLSIPGEQMPTLCQVLKLWHERGKLIFQEAPPNEQREFIRAPYEGPYMENTSVKEYQQPGYIPWDERLETPYISWAERRMRKDRQGS